MGSRIAVNMEECIQYYTKDNQNLLSVHKILKHPIYYINNEGIFLNEKFLFIYYKAQE